MIDDKLAVEISFTYQINVIFFAYQRLCQAAIAEGISDEALSAFEAEALKSCDASEPPEKFKLHPQIQEIKNAAIYQAFNAFNAARMDRVNIQ